MFKFGTDPELFIWDKKKERYVSAHNIIPGNKKVPYKVLGGAVQPDGLAAEFNIDAVDNYTDWEDRITGVLAELTKMVREASVEYELRFVPFANFEDAYFQQEVPAEAKILGCDPDYNWRGALNPNPGDKLQAKPIRTAAGHVHIGWTSGQELGGAHFEDCRYVSKHFFHMGFFQPITEEEDKRLGYYGMEGSFRPKSYGVELRQPSNLWVKDKKGRKWMYDTLIERMQFIYRLTENIRQAA